MDPVSNVDLVDLPERIAGPAAWYGPAMAARSDWLEILTPAECAEVTAATEKLASPTLDIAKIRKQDFPLPMLAPRLSRIRQYVQEGRGFALIRGLSAASGDIRRAAIAFFGIRQPSWCSAGAERARACARPRPGPRPLERRPEHPHLSDT